MQPYSQIILFAIQAAVRLEGQMKSAQIDQIKKHTINLVTPKFSGLVNERSATTWFMNDGKNTISDNTRLLELTQKARFDTRNMTKEENKELVDAYIRIRNLEDGLVKFDNINLSKNNIYALTSIKQWEDGTDPNPSPLQRIAGSLIEIGVDYFRNYSHLSTSTSTQGKLLMSFLDAIDDVNFAEGQLEDIATSFMTATIETLDGGVSLLGGDSNSSALLKCVAKGVIQDVNNYIKTTGSGNLLKQSEAKEWGQLIFKSVLSTAGTEVLANPNTFLGKKGASSEMITSVGNALLNSILTDIDAGNGVVVSLKNVFTTSTLDNITKASLQVLAEHPEWYAVDNQGLQNILTSLVKTVANYPNQLGMDMIPDLANLILGQTAGNLSLIYQGDPSKPANNLLLKTTTSVLNTLQNAVPKQAGQKWQPVFTKSQTLGLIDMMMQEVVANPDWILTSAAKANPMLEDVLGAVFKSLQGVSLVGMSTSTKMNIIKSAIETVAVNQGLLEKFHIDGEEKVLLNYGIDIALSFAFGDKATAKSKWALASGNALNMLIEAILVRLAKEGASESVIALTKEFLESEMQVLTEGQGVNIHDIAARLKSGDSLQTLLQNAVNTTTRISTTIIAENPGLLGIQNEDVKNLVSHLATSLAAYPATFSAAILPDLARMLILDTSENISLVVGSEPSSNLLVQASSIVINTLLPVDDNGKTTFNFSANQILALTDDVIQLVVSKPEWILTKAENVDPLLAIALSAIFETLNGASVLNLSNEAKINIMRSALQAVGEDKRLMQAVGINNELMMTLAINTVINTVQGKLTGDASRAAGLELTPEGITKLLTEAAVDNIKWALSDNHTIEKLSEAVLLRLAKEGASEEALALTNTLIAYEVIKIAKGEPFSLQNLLARLEFPLV